MIGFHIRTNVQQTVDQYSQLAAYVRICPIGNTGHLFVYFICLLSFCPEIRIGFHGRRGQSNTISGIAPVRKRNVGNRIHFPADIEDVLI